MHAFHTSSSSMKNVMSFRSVLNKIGLTSSTYCPMERSMNSFPICAPLGTLIFEKHTWKRIKCWLWVASPCSDINSPAFLRIEKNTNLIIGLSAYDDGRNFKTNLQCQNWNMHFVRPTTVVITHNARTVIETFYSNLYLIHYDSWCSGGSCCTTVQLSFASVIKIAVNWPSALTT